MNILIMMAKKQKLRLERIIMLGKQINNFHEIDKTPFGRNRIHYSSDGGYYGKGGFVYYFNSSLTIEEAQTYYRELVEDGLFNK